MSKGVPSRKEFEEMAQRGRLHEWLERISVIPSDSELETAQSPLDLGRLYGYPEEDIAHTTGPAGATAKPHTLSTCGTLRTPSYLHGPPLTRSKANRLSEITSQAFSLRVINAHTARTLGLTLPPTLRSCRRVIE
jgi:hypothetical protein